MFCAPGTEVWHDIEAAVNHVVLCDTVLSQLDWPSTQEGVQEKPLVIRPQDHLDIARDLTFPPWVRDTT